MGIDFKHSNAGKEEDDQEFREDTDELHGIEEIRSARTSGDKAYINWTDKSYLFHLHGEEPFDLDFVRVQRICEWYVYKGAGMTQKEVCRQYYKTFDSMLTHDYLRRMLKTLDVDKTSTPVAPHRIKDSTVEDNVKTWREREEAMIETSYMAKEAKNWKRKYKRLYNKLRGYEEVVEEAIDELRESGIGFPEWDAPEPRRASGEVVTPVFMIGDWHYGRAVEMEDNVFNKDVAERRLSELLSETGRFFSDYDRGVDNVHVVILGDMIDGVHGDMHDQQFIHQDVHGIDQMLGAARLISRYIKHLHDELDPSSITVHAVGGNHGRGRKDRREDPQRLPEMSVYHFSRLMCDPSIQWNIADEVTTHFRIKDTKVIATHGDRKPRKIQDLAWSHFESDVSNYLVVSGHKHSDLVEGASDRNVMHVRNGSLCGATEFSKKELAKFSRPSQSFVEVHEDGPRHGRTFYLT